MKFSAFIAAGFLAFGLVACGGESQDDAAPMEDTTTVEAPAPEPAPAMDDSTAHDSTSMDSHEEGEGH